MPSILRRVVIKTLYSSHFNKTCWHLSNHGGVTIQSFPKINHILYVKHRHLYLQNTRFFSIFKLQWFSLKKQQLSPHRVCISSHHQINISVRESVDDGICRRYVQEERRHEFYALLITEQQMNFANLSMYEGFHRYDLRNGGFVK